MWLLLLPLLLQLLMFPCLHRNVRAICSVLFGRWLRLLIVGGPRPITLLPRLALFWSVLRSKAVRWIQWPTCFKTMRGAPGRWRTDAGPLNPNCPNSRALSRNIAHLLILLVSLLLPLEPVPPRQMSTPCLPCLVGPLRLNAPLLTLLLGVSLALMSHMSWFFLGTTQPWLCLKPRLLWNSRLWLMHLEKVGFSLMVSGCGLVPWKANFSSEVVFSCVSQRNFFDLVGVSVSRKTLEWSTSMVWRQSRFVMASFRYFRKPYGAPRPTESENPPATKKEIPKTPKTPIISKVDARSPKVDARSPKVDARSPKVDARSPKVNVNYF